MLLFITVHRSNMLFNNSIWCFFMDTETIALIGYAIGTEVDAVSMYTYMIKHLPKDCSPVLKHILKEEREHQIELIHLLKEFKKSQKRQQQV